MIYKKRINVMYKKLITFTIMYAIATINIKASIQPKNFSAKIDEQIKQLQTKAGTPPLKNKQEISFSTDTYLDKFNPTPSKTQEKIDTSKENTTIQAKQLQIKAENALLKNKKTLPADESLDEFNITSGNVKENMTIAELFIEFLPFISKSDNILNTEKATFFFESHEDEFLLKYSQFKNNSWENEQDQNKLSIMFVSHIKTMFCDNKNNDHFIKNFGKEDIKPYTAFKKAFETQIKSIPHNTILKSLCSKEQINNFCKELTTIKKSLAKNQSYIAEKKTKLVNFEPEGPLPRGHIPFIPLVDLTSQKMYYIETGHALGNVLMNF